MSPPQRSTSCLMALALMLTPAYPARADGKFFPHLQVADEPGIQAQRALIAYKNGVETLIVQSEVATNGDREFAWLLPLPAQPTAIEPCPPNTLEALTTLITPDVAGPPITFLQASLLILIVVIIACRGQFQKGPLAPRPSWIIRIGVPMIITFALFDMLMPSLMSARHGQPTVDVLQAARAGVYDVTVLKGRTAAGVEGWLTSNGFACPDSAKPAIAAYVADDWVFLAAKIAPDAAGATSHHPLKVAFPTAKPVYPLRLTGTDGRPIQLDLFVIAPQPAQVPGMTTWFSDTMLEGQHHMKFGRLASESTLVYKPRTAPWTQVGMPAVTGLMWPNCTLTRLHARLTPSDMQQDLAVTWQNAPAARPQLHSRAAALAWAGIFAAIALALALIASTLEADRRGWSEREMLRKRFAACLILATTAGAIRYATLETVHVKQVSRTERAMARQSARGHAYALQDLLDNPPQTPFPQAYRAKLKELHDSDPPRETETPTEPGDYTIKPTPQGHRLTFIDWDYTPITTQVPGANRVSTTDPVNDKLGKPTQADDRMTEYAELKRIVEAAGFYTSPMRGDYGITLASRREPHGLTGNSFWVATRQSNWYLGTWGGWLYRIPTSDDVPNLCLTWLRATQESVADVPKDLKQKYQLIVVGEEEDARVFGTEE